MHSAIGIETNLMARLAQACDDEACDDETATSDTHHNLALWRHPHNPVRDAPLAREPWISMQGRPWLRVILRPLLLGQHPAGPLAGTGQLAPHQYLCQLLVWSGRG